MLKDYTTFFKIKMPNKGYHCPNGKDEMHIEKNLSFNCVCGQVHNAKAAYANIMFPIENKTLYTCPENSLNMVLVQPKCFFKVKGLKTIAAYKTKDQQELDQILLDIENRKRKS